MPRPVDGTNASTVVVKSAPANFSLLLLTPCERNRAAAPGTTWGPNRARFHQLWRKQRCVSGKARSTSEIRGHTSSPKGRCGSVLCPPSCAMGGKGKGAHFAHGHGKLLLVDAGVQVQNVVGVPARLLPRGERTVALLPQELSAPAPGAAPAATLTRRIPDAQARRRAHAAPPAVTVRPHALSFHLQLGALQPARSGCASSRVGLALCRDDAGRACTTSLWVGSTARCRGGCTRQGRVALTHRRDAILPKRLLRTLPMLASTCAPTEHLGAQQRHKEPPRRSWVCHK